MEDKRSRTRSELEAEIVSLRMEMPKPPIMPKLFLTDATPEALQEELAEQSGRSAIISDEGSLFEIISGLYSDGRCNLDVFLNGHAGSPLRVKRRDREVYLDNIAVTLGLAIQPQVLADLRANNKRSLRGKGLLARFLYCLPRSNIGSRDVRKRGTIPDEMKANYHTGVNRLLSIQPVQGPDGAEMPSRIGLTEKARELWQEFSQWIENGQGRGGRFESMQDFAGKLPGQALRIAGVCHVARSVDPTLSTLSTLSHGVAGGNEGQPTNKLADFENRIDESTMAPVLELCRTLLSHAEVAFDRLEDDSSVADAKWTLRWIHSHFERDEHGAYFVKQNEIHKTGRFKNSKLDRVVRALNVLQERNIVSPDCSLPTRKPTHVRYVNPSIVEANHSSDTFLSH